MLVQDDTVTIITHNNQYYIKLTKDIGQVWIATGAIQDNTFVLYRVLHTEGLSFIRSFEQFILAKELVQLINLYKDSSDIKCLMAEWGEYSPEDAIKEIQKEVNDDGV